MILRLGMVVRIHGAPHMFRTCAEADCTLRYCGEVDMVTACHPDEPRAMTLHRGWRNVTDLSPVCQDCRTLCEPVAHTIYPASRFGRSITLYVCNECAASRRAEG